MSQMKDNYQLLIEKLDQFTRKYYVNKLIRGTLYSVGLILALFTLFTVLEYYMYFSTSTRKVMFFSFVGISAAAVIGWIMFPLMNYFRLGKLISHKQAASIIGLHFADVKDKLLNVLQLKEQSQSSADASLINASINQKIGDIEPVPFKAAINLGENRKNLRFALPPLFLLLGILFFNGKIIEKGTSRLIKNGQEFEREAPFHFTLSNDDLSVVQFEDVLLEIKVEGEEYPNEAYIDIDNYKYKLTKVDYNTFTYKVRKVAKNAKFFFTASGFDSKSYDLNVLKKPSIVGFEVRLDYPAYTGRADEIISNIGDLVVPKGTKITWNFKAQNTDEVAVNFSNLKKADILKRAGKERFTLTKQVMNDAAYMVYVSNKNLQKADSVGYSLSAIPDVGPAISVEQFKDSSQSKVLFFAGDATDDYGLSKLNFSYTLEREKGGKETNVISIKTAMGKQAQYDYTWDLMNLGLNPGDKVSYFFEVFDNDGISGAKSARTSMMTYAMPSIDEFEQMEAKNNKAIKSDLNKAIEDHKQLKKDIKELTDKLHQKKELDWQDRKKLEDLMKRSEQIQKQMEEAKKNFDENKKNQSEFDEPNEQIKEKQEQLEKLFEEAVDDETKELMEKIEALLEELDKEKIMEQLENFEMSEEESQKNLERLKELHKQLEFERDMEKTTEDLNKLAEKQEKLSEETNEEKKSDEQLKKEQEELTKEFEKLEEKMEELKEKNEELKSPTKMDDMKEESEDVKKEQQKAEEQLQQEQKKGASKSQKKAADKMKSMANSMKMAMQSGQQQQNQEDIKALRQLLENLVNLSFDQEKLMEDSKKTQVNTPSYTALVQEQYKLKDDFVLVEDSLNALAQRVFQIESFVTEKVFDIKKNIKESIDMLEERQKSTAGVRQQRTMTGVNDLALMLSEVMEQMQQQMANQMKGSQMCQKPGSGQPMKGLGEKQQKLNEQLEKMKGQQEGDSPGGEGKSGKKGKGKGKGGTMSKEFAQAAAEQAAIRKALKDLQKQKMQQGKGSQELQKLIDEMDRAETDLVNKKITNEMMKRQQEIITRLLEAEKAEREQEYENQRKAEVAQNQEKKRPKELEDYIKKREAEVELYKSVSPALKPYYKTLVEEYYNSLKVK